MRITIEIVGRPAETVTLIDGSWLNHTWLGGEIKGLVKRGIDGWYDSLTPKDSAPVPIPQRRGSWWPTAVEPEHRILTIRGVHRAGFSGSSLQVSAFRDWLDSLIGEALRITVTDQAGPRVITGFLNAQVPVTLTDPRTTQFSLIITCPDPVKYGPWVASPVVGGVAEVETSGSAKTAPIVTVSGPVTRLRIQDQGGHVFQWAGDSSELTVDCADGFPLDGAGNQVGRLLAADEILVPPGPSTLRVDTDGSATVQVRSGWK